MRTTINIDGRLLEAAKKRAALRGVTLSNYIEDAIRHQLSAPTERVPAPVIPVFTRGNGMRAGVDPASNRSLRDALDESCDLSTASGTASVDDLRSFGAGFADLADQTVVDAAWK